MKTYRILTAAVLTALGFTCTAQAQQTPAAPEAPETPAIEKFVEQTSPSAKPEKDANPQTPDADVTDDDAAPQTTADQTPQPPGQTADRVPSAANNNKNDVPRSPESNAGRNDQVPRDRDANAPQAPHHDQADRGAPHDQHDQNANVNLGANFTMQQNRLTINNVTQNTLAARAGFRQGDVIVSMFGRPVASQMQFYQYMQTVPAGQRIPVIVMRNGTRQTIYLDGGEFATVARNYRPEGPQQFADAGGWLGVALDTERQDIAVVEGVQPGSPADAAGLQPGDWIVGINGQEIRGPGHLSHTVRQMAPGTRIEMQVSRRQTSSMNATLAERPAPQGFQRDLPPAPDQAAPPAPPLEQRGYRGVIESDRGTLDTAPNAAPRDRRLIDGRGDGLLDRR